MKNEEKPRDQLLAELAETRERLGHLERLEATRWRIEKDLEQLLQMTAAIVREIPSGLFVFQFQPPEQLILLNGNPEASRLTGITVEEHRGRAFHEIWPDTFGQGLHENLVGTVKTGESFESPSVAYRSDGEERIFRIRAFQLPEERLGLYLEGVPEHTRTDELAGRHELEGTEQVPVELAELVRTNELLRREIAEREQAERTLQEAQDRLAEELRDQTIQVSTVTQQLDREIAQRELVEEQLRKMESEIEVRIMERTEDLARAHNLFNAELEEKQRIEQELRKTIDRLEKRLEGSAEDMWEEATLQGRMWDEEEARELTHGVDESLRQRVEQLESDLVAADELLAQEADRRKETEDELERVRNELAGLRELGTALEDAPEVSLEMLDEPDTATPIELGSRESELREEIARRMKTEQALRRAVEKLKDQLWEQAGELPELDEALPEETYEQVPIEQEPASSSLHTLLIDASPFGIISFDTEGKVTHVNGRAVEILGAPSARDVAALNLLEAPSLVQAGFSDGLAGCLGAGDPFAGEFPYKSEWGKRIHARMTAAPLRNLEGEIIGGQAIVEDISDEKRTDGWLLRSERLNALGNMAGPAAHSLETYLERVAREARKAVASIEAGAFANMGPLMERILGATRRAALTARRLRQCARPRSFPDPSKPMEVFDLSEVVREGVEMDALWSRPDPDRDGIEVSIDLDLAAACQVEGQGDEIIELVVNLLENAVEALPQGGTISVKTRLEQDRVLLEVQDNGVGMPTHDLSRIFEPFWTSKEGHDGLGLAVNYGIVRRHGGTVSVKSRPGVGTTFTVALPQSGPTEAASVMRSRVLFVCDLPPLARVVRTGLNRLGHAAIVAKSAEQGIEIFAETKIDAVVCDPFSDPMSAWDLSRAVHDMCLQRGTAKPPFLLLTGAVGQSLDSTGMAYSEVDRILRKPVAIPSLAGIIVEEIGRAATSCPRIER